MGRSWRRGAGMAALWALLQIGACVPSLQGNEAREPNAVLPGRFGAGAPASGESVAQQAWDRFFQSAHLQNLIALALANNQELNIQLQELIIAKNEVSARRGEYAPRIGAKAGAGVDKVGKHTSQGASDEDHGLPEHLGDFGFGLVGSWEVDVWGRLRDAADAAELRYRATREARRFLVTQLVAELARSYFELVSLDQQIEVIRRNIDLQSSALAGVRLQKEAARVTELAVQRFEAELLKNRSRLYEVEQERVFAENRINFLVGRYPQPVERDTRDFAGGVAVGLETGLPAALLENRPDVRRAELELAAAKLDVSAARKAFYPALSIDAGLGYRSFNAKHLVDTPESLAYGIAGGLTAPLLNRAAITAEYRSANARQLQAVFNYEQVLLRAFTEVVSQLSRMKNLASGYELQREQVAVLARSVEVANTLFQSARADYVEVLLTRRDSIEAELQLIETMRGQYLALVDTYQALGGGWRTRKPTPPANPPRATP